jgi:hypothetical protein
VYDDCGAQLSECAPPFELTLHCGVCRAFHCCKTCYRSNLALPRRRRTREQQAYGDDDDDEDAAGTEFRGWDHALGGFTCYKCQVAAQTGLAFGPGAQDELLGMLERQRQLDVAHHTADKTAAGHLGHLRRLVLWQGDMGVHAAGVYPARAPQHGDAAVTVAWHVLLRSLDPGKVPGSTLAASSLAKIRSALSCAHDDTTVWALAGRRRQRFPLAPTLSNQYEWFVLGLERRLGTDSQQAYVFSFAAFVEVVSRLEAQFVAAAAAPAADTRGSAAWGTLWDLAHEGLYWHVAFFGSFRAGEALRIGWDQVAHDQRLDEADAEPHLKLVVEKTKNSQTRSVSVLIAATSWHPAPCSRRWFRRVEAMRLRASDALAARRGTRLFVTGSGKAWTQAFVLHHSIRPRLRHVQDQGQQPEIARSVCIAKEVTGNSMRRSATTAMQASGRVPDHIMDGHCRWKQEDHMRDVYSHAPLADKLKASFFMADAERIVQRRNSPASRPVRRVLVSDSSGSGSD